MWTTFVVFVSLCLGYSHSEDTDSCSVVPVYRNVCGADIYPCIGRTTTAIPLRCAASDASGGCSYGWFHARDLITISDATLVVEGSDLPAPTPGYWWCDILDQSLNPQSCSLSVPAIHIYPCTCKDADSTSLQICPTNNRSCRRTLLDPCPPGLSLYCLTTTRVELLTQVILTATKTVPVTTETKRTATVQTRGIPYHVASSSEHGVTTTQTMSPLLTGMNNTRMATNLSVLPLYVVGPIVVVVVISIFVLLVAIGCIKHRRKRLGTREGQRQSNSRSFTMYNGGMTEEHIYDTPIPSSMKEKYSGKSPNHPTVASEYEIPVTKCRSASEANGQQMISSTNPVCLHLYDKLNVK